MHIDTHRSLWSRATGKIADMFNTSIASSPAPSDLPPLVGNAVGRQASGLVEAGFVPGNGATHKQLFQRSAEELRQNTFLYLNCSGAAAETVTLKTRDGCDLDAVWKGSDQPRTSPTVVIFHGNGCTLDSMAPMGRWFAEKQINVLMITMRGYPGSTGDTKKSGELGFYLDAEASIDHVLNARGVDRTRLFCHGYSMGGALAAAAGYFYDLPVTLDHTFTSAGAMVKNIGQGTFFPTWVVKGVADNTYASGKTYNDPEGRESPVATAKPLVTDGLNSLAKLEQSIQPFFVLYGTEDKLMPTSFADEFYASRFGPPPGELDHPTQRQAYVIDKSSVVVPLSGGHCHWFTSENETEARLYYQMHMLKHNLLDQQYSDLT